PITWLIGQVSQNGPRSSQPRRLPSPVKVKAPFLVPTSNKTRLAICTFLPPCTYRHTTATSAYGSSPIASDRRLDRPARRRRNPNPPIVATVHALPVVGKSMRSQAAD